MASIFRLTHQQLLPKILRTEKAGLLSFVRPVTIKASPAVAPKDVGHDERNMKLGRPQSPHLTIYAPQITTMLSISHRATGMMLAGYTVLFGAGAIILPDSIPHYLEGLEQAQINGALLASAKFLIAFPMAYHFWNGIRHLTWDMAKFMSLKEVYLTGYIMLAVSTVSAIVLTNM